MQPSPELDLLRVCCRDSRAPGFAAHIQKVSTQISRWSVLIETLVQHEVDSFVYSRLQEAPGAVPDQVMSVLAERAARNAAGALQQTSELTDLIQDLSVEALEAVCLRGPLLSAALYGSSSIRIWDRVELGVREQDRAAIRKIIQRRGYVLDAQSAGKDRFEGPGKARVTVVSRIPHPEKGPPLELAGILPRCVPAEVAGVKTLAIAHQDLPILLAIYGANQQWPLWGCLVDLDVLMRSDPNLNLTGVKEYAADLHLWRTVQAGLILSHAVLETPVPKQMLEATARDQDMEALIADARTRLFGVQPAPETAAGPAERGNLERTSHAAPHFVARPSPPSPTLSSPGSGLELRAYRLPEINSVPVPATRTRGWMDRTHERFAYRCVPLVLANQAGWHILNPRTIEVEWDGGDGMEAIRVRALSGAGRGAAHSHFGYGIVTWHIPFLFRTPPGYNLWVKGPANSPKDGVCALEGVVETDWAEATFTMNWQLTRPGHVVRFEEGEPICCIVPQRRGELEQFDPVVEELAEAPDEHQRYQRWSKSRDVFLDLEKSPLSRPRKRGQMHYFHGESLGGERFEEHQNKLNLRAFRKRRPDS